MTTKFKQIFGESVQFMGDGSPVQLSAPGSSLELAGTVNITSGDNPAGLTIDGIDILDYVGTTQTFDTIAVNNLTNEESNIIADHPDADGAIVLRLPLISTLASTKRYRIEFKGDLRLSTRYIRVHAATDTTNTMIGDTVDNQGITNTSATPDVWDHAWIDYHRHGTIEIESIIGGYTAGTTNGWRIISSHLQDYSLIKQPVHATATANVTFPIFAGNTMDGVTLKAGDRVLLRNQSDATQNGVYIVSVDAQHPDIRSHDMEANTVYASGFEFFITDGTQHGGEHWYVTNKPGSDRVAVNSLDFKKVSGVLKLTKGTSAAVQTPIVNSTVTSDEGAGKIQTVSLTIASHSKETFSVNCEACLTDSLVFLQVQEYLGDGSISLMASGVGLGSFDITITNSSGTTLNAVSILGYMIA